MFPAVTVLLLAEGPQQAKNHPLPWRSPESGESELSTGLFIKSHFRLRPLPPARDHTVFDCQMGGATQGRACRGSAGPPQATDWMLS